MPRAMFSSVSISRYERNSSALSRSRAALPKNRREFTACGLSRCVVRRGVENSADGPNELFPAAGLRRQLLAAQRRQPVVLRLAVVLGRAPERLDPTAILQSMEGWIQGAMLDLEHVLRAAF